MSSSTSSSARPHPPATSSSLPAIQPSSPPSSSGAHQQSDGRASETPAERAAVIRELRTRIDTLECDSGLSTARDKEDYIRHLAPNQLVELVVGMYRAIDESLHVETQTTTTTVTSSTATNGASGGGHAAESTPLVPVFAPLRSDQQHHHRHSAGRDGQHTPPTATATAAAAQHHLFTPPSLKLTPGEKHFGEGPDAFAPWSDQPVINLNMSCSEESDTERDPLVLSRGARASVSEEGFDCINEYILLKEIGRGQYGSVYLAHNQKTEELRAIKKLPRSIIKRKDDGANDNASPLSTAKVADIDIAREVAIMKKMRHKNIVALYEVIDDVEEDSLYLVMQYADAGPIFELRRDFTCDPLPEDLVKDYLRQLVAGLSYLQKHKVVHMDIKNENTLKSKDGDILLADFGMSEVLRADVLASSLNDDAELATTPSTVADPDGGGAGLLSPKAQQNQTRGTPAFLPPEMIAGSHEVSAACDTWALGVMLFCMLYGRLPFVGRNVREMMQNIIGTEPQFPDNADPVWVDLVKGLLNKNPDDRTTLQALRRHPKIAGGGVAGGRARSLSLSPGAGAGLSPLSPSLDVSEFEIQCAFTSKQPRGRRHQEEFTLMTSPDGKLTASLGPQPPPYPSQMTAAIPPAPTPPAPSSPGSGSFQRKERPAPLFHNSLSSSSGSPKMPPTHT